jgi:hypothetical protein
VLLYDLTSGAAPRAFEAGVRAPVAAAMSRDAKLLAAGDTEGRVRVWDTRDPSATPLAFDVPLVGEATALTFDADGGALFVGYRTGALRAHPLRVRAALERACDVLAHTGRAGVDHCEAIRTSRNATNAR